MSSKMSRVLELDKELSKLRKKRNRQYAIRKYNKSIKELKAKLEAGGGDQKSIEARIEILIQQKEKHPAWLNYKQKMAPLEAMLESIPRDEIERLRNERKEEKQKQREMKEFEIKQTFKALQERGIETGKYLTFDIERYEFNQNITLEIGISFGNFDFIQTEHYVILENQYFRNGVYCPDNRDNFSFGKSEIKPEDEIMQILKSRIENAEFILGHGFQSDKKFLRDEIVNAVDEKGIIDAQFCYQILKKQETLKSVEKICGEMNIQTKCLHNAGNDAFYTLKYFLKLLKEEKGTM